jgi:hypothetical protein
MAGEAISAVALTRQRESARVVCFMHLRDLTNAHPHFAPPRAMEFVRQWEAAARERRRERQNGTAVWKPSSS